MKRRFFSSPPISLFPILALIGLFILFPPFQALAAETASADVVVIVDTSTSMREPGMDPERASLLVTKLLADIAPGELAVVRLLGILPDSNLLPHRPTNQTGACPENPQQECVRVERASDWEADARANRYGALIRPRRGDAGFKKKLESHLEQRIANSMFTLAFQAAMGVFDGHPAKSGPRLVIWLSDGNSEHEELLKQVIAEVKAAGIAVEAIVFGAGDTRLPVESGAETTKVSNPAEMMNAFANSFRRIVQAPYRIDNRLDAAPGFEMKRNVHEAWVVVYGDKTLGEVEIVGPGQTVKADYAADVWPSAGAYKVAYLQDPPPGAWTVKAQGGGQGVAYAVIQRSDLRPVLLEPQQALTGVPTCIVAGISDSQSKEPFTDPEVLKDARLTLTVEGQALSLRDDGLEGDAKAGDGRFTGSFAFPKAGLIPLRLDLQSTLVSRSEEASVQVGGTFHYGGGPVEVDLGTLGPAAESCRPVPFQAEQEGEVPFELEALRPLPSGHALEVRLPAGVLQTGGKPVSAKAGAAFQICLKTLARIGSSQASGEPWLALKVAGSQENSQTITLKLRWQVQGLSFWELWGWLVWIILGLLALLFVLLGFILPQRFRGALAVVFVPDREDLDEQTPQPVKQWKGVGIGFYRDARAFLHPDYRLSGKSRGALAGIVAERGGTRALPCNGVSLYRENLDGEYEPIPPHGVRCRAGDVFRIGGSGPYFRIATRG